MPSLTTFRRTTCVLGLLLALAGCDSSSDTDAGPRTDASFDAGWVDAGPRDSGPADAGPTDAGPTDAGPTDGGADAGPADSGPVDGGPVDAGPTDGGADSGPVDGGPVTCWDMEVNTVGSGVATGNTTGASNDISNPAPDRCDGLGPDAQVLFTAPSDGSYAFVVSTDDFDPSISLHSASCSFLTELACADDTGEELDATASAFLSAGDSIIVNVDGLGVDDSGAWRLNVSRMDDTCPDEDLGTVTESVIGELTAASGDHRHAPCTIGGGGNDLSYRFTAPRAGEFRFTVTVSETGGTPDWDPVVYTIEDDCGGRLGVCNDMSSFEGDAQVTATLASGESVIVVVEGASATDLGLFELDVCEAPCL